MSSARSSSELSSSSAVGQLLPLGAGCGPPIAASPTTSSPTGCSSAPSFTQPAASLLAAQPPQHQMIETMQAVSAAFAAHSMQQQAAANSSPGAAMHLPAGPGVHVVVSSPPPQYQQQACSQVAPAAAMAAVGAQLGAMQLHHAAQQQAQPHHAQLQPPAAWQAAAPPTVRPGVNIQLQQALLHFSNPASCGSMQLQQAHPQFADLAPSGSMQVQQAHPQFADPAAAMSAAMASAPFTGGAAERFHELHAFLLDARASQLGAAAHQAHMMAHAMTSEAAVTAAMYTSPNMGFAAAAPAVQEPLHVQSRLMQLHTQQPQPQQVMQLVAPHAQAAPQAEAFNMQGLQGQGQQLLLLQVPQGLVQQQAALPGLQVPGMAHQSAHVLQQVPHVMQAAMNDAAPCALVPANSSGITIGMSISQGGVGPLMESGNLQGYNQLNHTGFDGFF